MSKRGIPYQDLVAKVEAALDPDAKVTVGEWIEGPDGDRDCDVSVRGTHDGRPYFVFIECKDWKKPVGIATVDSLDSVRRDLGVDLAMIYSNSGFTGPAIKKGDRLGINLLTAVASNDGRSRARAHMLTYGRLLDVTNLNEQVIEPEGQDLPIPPGVTMENILYEGKPVHNWLVAQVEQELRQDEDRFEDERYVLTLKYGFGSVITFDMAGVPFPVAGVAVSADVEVKWMSKVLSLSADLARFNLKTSRLTIPPSVPFTLGPLDSSDWEPSEPPPRDRLRADPDVPELHVRAELGRRLDLARGGTAELDPLVSEKAVELTEVEAHDR
jgi:Restriction endonuclease